MHSHNGLNQAFHTCRNTNSYIRILMFFSFHLDADYPDVCMMP